MTEPTFSRPSRTELVGAALHDAGEHPSVPVEILSVEQAGDLLAISIRLLYRVATPVCCPEPGCYVPFLGGSRERVPGLLAAALGLSSPPRVSMRVELVYEPGYAHSQLGTASPCTLTYEPDEFTSRLRRSTLLGNPR